MLNSRVWDFDLIPKSEKFDLISNAPPINKGASMLQMQLPIFPSGVTYITNELAFQKVNDQVTYFNGSMPVFTHAANDIIAFRLITSQFYINGSVTQAEIIRAFGISPISIKRSVKIYKTCGTAGFFKKKNTRKAIVLTKPVLAEAQKLLNEGHESKEVASRLAIKPDTLKKAISSGRLVKVEKKVL